jgi:hypothetical protein
MDLTTFLYGKEERRLELFDAFESNERMSPTHTERDYQ